MRRHGPTLLAAALSLTACSADELPPGAEFLRFVQRDADVLVWVGDLLPHLRAALDSEPLMQLLEERPVFPGLRFDPAQLRLQLQAVRQYVPAGACLSIPREGLVALGAVWRALVAGTACEQALSSGGEALRQAQEDFAAAVAELRAARASLYVGFRDPRTAERLFDQLLDLRAMWVMNPAFEVEEKLDALEIRVRPGSFADSRMFPELLSEVGLVASREDPGVDLIREAVSPLEARIVIELIGDGLVLTLGARSGRKPTVLTGLWRHDRPPAAYLQWDLGALQAAVSGLTPRPGLPLAEPGLPLQARIIAHFLNTAPRTGSLRVDLDGQTLSVVAEHDPATWPDLPALRPEASDRLDIRAESETIGDRARSELRISLRR